MCRLVLVVAGLLVPEGGVPGDGGGGEVGGGGLGRGAHVVVAVVVLGRVAAAARLSRPVRAARLRDVAEPPERGAEGRLALAGRNTQ